MFGAPGMCIRMPARARAVNAGHSHVTHARRMHDWKRESMLQIRELSEQNRRLTAHMEASDAATAEVRGLSLLANVRLCANCH